MKDRNNLDWPSGESALFHNRPCPKLSLVAVNEVDWQPQLEVTKQDCVFSEVPVFLISALSKERAQEVVVGAAERIALVNQKEDIEVPFKAETWVFCLEARKKR